jgi:uncharacterized protein
VSIDVTTERRTSGPVTVGVVALLAVANVMSNRVLPVAAYVPWNLSVAVGCVLIARRAVTFAEMGLGRWKSGLGWGMYHDRRVGTALSTMLYQTLVRIPLGTVVLEEIAFRGVLPALLGKRVGIWRGCVGASMLFGLWHVLPALGLSKVNPAMTHIFGDGAAGVAVAVLFAVVGTTIGGLFWCWIRYRSGSVLSTMIAHVATNSVGYAIAWFVTR